MIGDRIAAEAENWLGVPFHWQGRVKVGCDCKGLIAGVAANCGRDEGTSLQALAGDYSDRVDSAALLQGMAALFDPVTERKAGDILVLMVSGKPQHLAIAAPTDTKPSRTIQALHTGPQKVVAMRVPRATVHSIWRWRD